MSMMKAMKLAMPIFALCSATMRVRLFLIVAVGLSCEASWAHIHSRVASAYCGQAAKLLCWNSILRVSCRLFVKFWYVAGLCLYREESIEHMHLRDEL
jgi:hypothetical protein